jgi:hypothetical protein
MFFRAERTIAFARFIVAKIRQFVAAVDAVAVAGRRSRLDGNQRHAAIVLRTHTHAPAPTQQRAAQPKILDVFELCQPERIADFVVEFDPHAVRVRQKHLNHSRIKLFA